MKRLLFLLLLAASICLAQNQPNNNPAGANNTWVVVGNPAQQFSPTQKGTIQDAVNFAGPGGVVWIPPSYAGTESLLSIINPNNVLMVDMRGGTFQTYPPLPTGGSGGSTTPPVASAVVSPVPGIDYGTVQHLQPGPSQIVTISSNGTLPFTVTGVTFTGPFSVLSNPCLGVQLIPGNSCSLLVFPTPVGTGAVENGSVAFATTAPVIPQSPLVAPLKVRSTTLSLPSFLLTLTGFGTGSGTVSDGGLLSVHFSNGVPDAGSTFQLNYQQGTVVTLTQTADPGSTFVAFAGAGCGATCVVTMNAAATVAATFNLTPVTKTVSIACGGQGDGDIVSDLNDVNTGLPVAAHCSAGSVSGRTTITQFVGTAITFTESPSLSGATHCPGANCTFGSWVGPLTCTNTSSCQVNLAADNTLAANFNAPAAAAPAVLQGFIAGGCGTPTNTCGAGVVTGLQSEATTAGDTNVVGILWNDATTTVSGVTDTKGNTYTQVSCSPKVATGLTLAVYYAKNLAAAAINSNTITGAMSASPASRLIFVLHYSGLDPTAPFDVCAGNTGTGTALSTGATAATAQAGELLVGFTNVANHITAVSTGFAQEILTSGNDAEDKLNQPIAAYTFAPTQSNATAWSAIVAAFKTNATGGGGGTNNTVTIQCGGNGSGNASGGGLSVRCVNGQPTSGDTLSASVVTGGSLPLTAQSLAGSSFANYQGAPGCGVNPSCNTSPITVNSNITVTFTTAGPTVRYTGGTGQSDSNNGQCPTTSTSGCTGGPFATIQKGINALAAAGLGAGGSTLNVAPATYNECLTSNLTGTSSQPVIYQSTGLASSGVSHATIVCNGATTPGGLHTTWVNGTGSNTRTADYVSIIGFEVAPSTPTNMCEGISQYGAFGHINFNVVHDIKGQALAGTGFCGGGGAAIDFHNNGNAPTVEHDNEANGNIIDNVGTGPNGDGTNCANVHGIYIQSPRVTATNNIISRACGWAIHMFHDTYQDVIANNIIINNYNGGILVSASDGFTNDNTSVMNNVLAHNGNESAIEERWGTTGSNNVYRNNRFWLNSNPGNCLNPPSGFALCQYWFANGARTVSGPLTVGTDAIFVAYTGNARTGDYHSATGTVLTVDSGATGPCAVSPGITPCVPPLAIDGTTRPQRTGYDQGPYELP